mgnify:CR=1 FL=1
MARSFSPSDIEESETAVAVRLSDGSTQYLSKTDVYEMMRGGGGGGINVDQLANGATALSGMLAFYQDDKYRDDLAHARNKLGKANQAFVDELRKQPNGIALANAFIKTCKAQNQLDRSQDLINRSQDMAILVNSGSAAAKALISGGPSGYGSGIGTEEFLLGGAALWIGAKALGDGGRRRRWNDEDEDDFDDLGDSTVPK